MNKKAERGMETRRLLLDVGTRLFAERGYEGTSIETVLDEAGISRGALYHHFGGKDKLFEAVLDQLESDVGSRVLAAAAAATDIRDALRLGCRAWLAIAREPAVRQILLHDAPAVLGWDRWRALEEQYALGNLRTALAAAADAGIVPADLVDMFAHILLAALTELVLIAAQDDQDPATAEHAVDELLRRLLTP